MIGKAQDVPMCSYSSSLGHAYEGCRLKSTQLAYSLHDQKHVLDNCRGSFTEPGTTHSREHLIKTLLGSLTLLNSNKPINTIIRGISTMTVITHKYIAVDLHECGAVFIQNLGCYILVRYYCHSADTPDYLLIGLSLLSRMRVPNSVLMRCSGCVLCHNDNNK